MEPTTWNSVLLRETHSRVRKTTHTRVGTALGMMGVAEAWQERLWGSRPDHARRVGRQAAYHSSGFILTADQTQIGATN